MTNKIEIKNEIAFIAANILLALAVAMMAAANFGLSMIVAPAYILSEKVSFLTFGQAEYVIQFLLFIVFCILMKKIKLTYFCSFITCLIYGAILDLWRWIIPLFNPSITPPDTIALWIRIILFIIGELLTTFSIALHFKAYFPPQVYDFFVKAMSSHFKIDRTKFKRIYDVSSFVVACILTLVFFGKFVGIGWGTIILVVCNSILIGFFDKLLDKYFIFKPIFPDMAKKFDSDIK